MIEVMRTTHTLIAVAKAMLDDPTGKYWGYDLSKRTGVRSGVLYPILTRMLNADWVTDGWEDASVLAREKRLPRRYYELTDKGHSALDQMVRARGRSAPLNAEMPPT
jgi:PadR family transcriptional regulator, regulatory protein PadR